MTYSSPHVNPCSGELCNNASPIFPDPYRNIIPDQPDSPWVAAFTYIRAAIGFCYLAVVLDSCSRKVIGHTLSRHLRDRLVDISLYFFDLGLAHETAFRTYPGLNLQAAAQSQNGRTPRRGPRRIHAFMPVLEGEPNIRPEQTRSLAAALGMATGAEAMIALFDIAGLSAEEARAVVAETAEAVCDRMLPWT